MQRANAEGFGVRTIGAVALPRVQVCHALAVHLRLARSGRVGGSAGAPAAGRWGRLLHRAGAYQRALRASNNFCHARVHLLFPRCFHRSSVAPDGGRAFTQLRHLVGSAAAAAATCSRCGGR
jgi:hypothetical protein